MPGRRRLLCAPFRPIEAISAMSHTQITPAPARLNRSELAVPGSSPRFFEKAAAGEADIVFLDLEDAVAPDKKAEARKNVVQAIGDCDWGDKALSVRINGLDTPYMYRDVVDLLENCSERLDLIMIPKLGTARGRLHGRRPRLAGRTGDGAEETRRLRADYRDGARHAEHRGDRRRQPAQRKPAFSARRTMPPRPGCARCRSAAPTRTTAC